MSDIKVVGLGALNMDYIYRVESLPGDGESADIPEYRETEMELVGAFPGGSAANTIYGLAKLGVKTGFIGAVGDDADGKKMLEDFKKVGVDTGQIRVKPEAKTGFTKCLIDKLSFRSIHVSPEANNLLKIDDLDTGYVNKAEILHISSFIDNRQFEMLLELIPELNPAVKISFSPGALYATRGLKTLAPILERTHVLFLNGDEIRQMTGQDIHKGAESCLKHGCRIVAVTLGKGTRLKNVIASGYIRDTDNEYIVEPSGKKEVPAPDTTGAGDAFAAGFLYGFFQGSDLKECGHLGNIVAQFSIQKIGARDGLPSLDELSKRYKT